MTAKKAAKKTATKKKVTHAKKEHVSTPEDIVNNNGLSATVTNVEPAAPPLSTTVVHESPEPVFQTDTRFDPAVPNTYISLVVRAWEEVRGPGDAHFGDAAPDFQRTLLDHAKDVLRTNVVQEGDTFQARFERAFKRLKDKGE